MRRTLPVLLAATLLFAACSSDGDASTDETNSDSTTAGTEAETSVADDGADPTEATDTTEPPTNPDKPEVEIPDEIPTELTITVIEPGTGPEAQAGDTVVVDYVGVRSSDGVEFDSSYDARQQGVPPSPFTLVLGEGSVIAGWDQGLEGATAGSRIRIDIPSELAYGPESRGEIIGPDEALTFLIDVRAVIPPTDASDAPTDPGVDASAGVDGIEIEDTVEGTGTELLAGQTAIIRYALFRGDNLVFLVSNWGQPPTPLPIVEGTFPVLYEGLPGMKVGGRRVLTFPPQYPDYGFGPEGSPTDGLPAETDVIMVVDLLAAYGTPES
jgi:peptidylprolyl isomerase